MNRDMKTIVNKLRFALLLGFLAVSVTAWSQGVPYINKMSISTQMFLDEMAGRINLNDDGTVPIIKAPGTDAPILRHQRPIATPDTIEGKVYISATVRVVDIDSDVQALENLGVIIQCKFDKGLVTTLIPIDKIEEVNNLEGVKRIQVATVMRSLTNLSRTASNVDDVLTLSADAQNAGLSSIYDGTGVILAVIDDGIDYQHGAFKDKNGNSRIKGAYCYNGSSVTADWTGSGTLPTTDDTSEDHGTHTSTIAGGSSVIVNGTSVTVTDNHANATYGGMAPGADMFLCGTQLYDTYILNSFQKVCNYADAQGKPVVISNSWGGSVYANDGNTDMNDVFTQYFGDSHPNHICLFASGNEASKSAGGVTGGYYVTGASTSANPLGTIIRTESYAEGYGYAYVGGILANAWTRATDASGIAVHAYVINKTSGALVYDMGTLQSTNYNAGTGATLNANSYFGRNRNFTVYFDYTQSNGKHQALIYTGNDMTSGTNYALAIEVYPIGGSNNTVDIWGGTYSYLAGNVTTSGHTWTAGTDDMSATGECTNENVISVGSYVTRTRSGSNSVGQISDFSSYALASTGPNGVMFPWITAPGEDIISGYNHYVSSHEGTVSVNNSTSPYGLMSGTSMATPHAAGIVALWFQAAQEVGKDLTLSEVKNIMAQTATHDQWTNGTYSNRFGNGKINALAGIQYILDNYGTNDPTIRVSPSTLDFTNEPGTSSSQTVTVSGNNLTGDITATLNDNTGTFSINRAVNLGSGGTLTVTYAPSAVGNHNATITLTSPGADNVTVTLNGVSQIKTDDIVCDGGATNQYLPVYGYYYDEAQVNQMLYPASKFTGNGMEGNKITRLTFYPTRSGNYSGINFYYQASRGNGTVTVKLANMPSGTAGYAATATHKNANFTTVKTITMPSSAQTGLTEWVFENLDNEFIYEGGDLLIEVTTEAGMYGYTYFAGESQSTYTGYYSYGSTSRGQQFLPKLKLEWEASIPITAGTVSPNTLTFTDVRIGRTQTETVTVSNTGNQAFTPVIDTTNLPAEFSVTGNGEVLPGGTLNLTVEYTPTDAGPHSGSFTVTIGDVTYIVTVTGNGIVVNSTLTSNEVTVPVYKTDLEVLTVYSLQDLQDDIDHSLTENLTNTDVNVKVKRDNAITRYDVYHNEGTKVTNENWATGGTNASVAYATHNTNDYIPFAKNQETMNSWVQQPTVTFPNGVDEMWVHLNDYVEVQGENTWYVPVVVADGVVTTGNTYGAPIHPSYTSSMTATVNYDQSTIRTDANNNNAEYYYMTAEVVMHCVAPQVEAGADYHYECFLARAWRQWTPYIVGVGAGQLTETLMGEAQLSGTEDEVTIGCKDFQMVNGQWSMDEPVFCSPANTTPLFISRFYYKRVPNNAKLNAGGGGGGGGGGAGAPGDGPTPPENPTGLADFTVDKEISSVTYVNSLGMTSDKPFEGVNIIITRYTDGTTSTSKAMKR